jgi:CRISPR/Cas system-associated exonuclease Cas4 (RecB family)
MKTADQRITLSRWQLELFVECPRCFWLLKQHGIRQPEGYPLAINIAIDALLKAEFDQYRAKGERHPILTEHRISAKLFGDLKKLQEWRSNVQGLRWTDPATGHTLYGAVDDILEFPDGSLAVLDYKSSGAREITIYPSYQLQMDVYTFLLQRLGYRTASKAFFAFFMVVKDEGFGDRLPFRRTLVAVTPQPERVLELFRQAVALALSDEMPKPGEKCDLCRWFHEAGPILRDES